MCHSPLTRVQTSFFTFIQVNGNMTSSSAVAEAARCFVSVSFKSTISSASSASDLPLRGPTYKFCSVLFSSSCMLQAVINIASLMRRRRCVKLHGGLSHLFAGPACHRSIASCIAYDRDLCLHLTPPLGGSLLEYCHDV